MPDIAEVDASEWETWVADNQAAVIDVRNPHEWELGTLPGALLIPLTDVVERTDEIPTDRPILLVCRSGNRSERVAEYLASIGFERVANMTGGMKALGMQD